MRKGVNGRAAGQAASENPEKYVIVSSTVITTPAPASCYLTATALPLFLSSPCALPSPTPSPPPLSLSLSLSLALSFFLSSTPSRLRSRCSHCALLIPVYCRPKQ